MTDREGPRGIDGVSRFMGFEWESADVIRVTIREDLINGGGLLSGAVTYAMVDYCMGSALWAETTEDEGIATVNISINYMQTATAGEVICTTQLDRRNRRLAVLRSEVHHEDGRRPGQLHDLPAQEGAGTPEPRGRVGPTNKKGPPERALGPAPRFREEVRPP